MVSEHGKKRRTAASERLDPDLLGPCMLYCGYCGVYRSGKCEGCAPMSSKMLSQGKVFCPMYECARSRGVRMCADCDAYPCDRFDKGVEDAPLFSREFTRYLRDNTD